MERIRDFIILHYKPPSATTRRSGATAATWRFPTRSAQRIELFRESAQAYQATDEMFRVESWMQVMLGQRLQPRGYHHMGRMLGPERLRKALETLQGQHRRRGVTHALRTANSCSSYCASP